VSSRVRIKMSSAYVLYHSFFLVLIWHSFFLCNVEKRWAKRISLLCNTGRNVPKTDRIVSSEEKKRSMCGNRTLDEWIETVWRKSVVIHLKKSKVSNIWEKNLTVRKSITRKNGHVYLRETDDITLSQTCNPRNTIYDYIDSCLWFDIGVTIIFRRLNNGTFILNPTPP